MKNLRELAVRYVIDAVSEIDSTNSDTWKHDGFRKLIRENALNSLDSLDEGQPDSPPDDNEMERLVQTCGLDFGQVAALATSISRNGYCTAYERYQTAISMLIDDVLGYPFETPESR